MALVAAVVLAACGGEGSRDTQADGGPGLTGLTAGTGEATEGTGAASSGAMDESVGATEGEDAVVELQITPQNPFLEVVDGVLPAPIQMEVVGITASGEQVPVSGVWEVDRLDVATIDTFTGELGASGIAGGVTAVRFSSGDLEAETPATVKLHITDDGGVDDSVKNMFGMGGAPDPTLTLLYPYDETVFPRDLIAPVVQWNGGTAVDTYYLHLDAPTFEFEAWFAGVDPGRYTFPVLPADVWKKLTASVVAADIDVELQRYDGASVYAPVTSSWHIADADLIGTIYYWEVNQGNVVRLKVGEPAPETFLQKPPGVTCVACHSVSANGSTLVAAFHGGYSPWGTFETSDGASLYATDTTSGFEAISPDGDYVVWGQTSGVANLSTFDSINVLASLPPVGGGFPAFPAWSPDGSKLAYSVRTDGNWLDFNNSTLWVSDVDTVTPGFANDHQLVAATASRTAVTYPTWSPDSQWLAFGRATQARTRGALGELGMTNLDGTQQLALDRACGVGSLAADQSSACYEPTFMPESRGGYLWLVFVSERTYGNILTDTAADTRHKQLWVTAIDDPPQPGQDPSHPAFWLPGQETNNQNMRGAWTLDPPDIAR
ncbi:MAG: PD40 domain-containing protein [Myxococcales bacterium]|nr:PD40 domain-containing protein [Myxococcales bacterium]MCB9716204.1 PD40 domain-containing protein [Myxococcales bacterium]